MPIRFSGSARPKKLKSPDPINMPSVRENIVPRIKAEVAYYKDNGSLPSVELFWQTSGTYFTHPIGMTNSGIEIFNGYLYVNNAQRSLIESFRLSDQAAIAGLGQSGNNQSDIYVTTNRVIYGATQTGTDSVGLLVSVPNNTSTGTLPNNKTVWEAAGGSYTYDGRSIAVVESENIVFTGGEGYTSTGTRRGAFWARNLTSGAELTSYQWTFLGDSSPTRTSSGMPGELVNGSGIDWRMSRGMSTDGTRLAVTVGGLPGASESIARAGVISVWNTSATGAVEIQHIANPTPEGVANVGTIECVQTVNDKLFMFLLAGGPDVSYAADRVSVAEYEWNGSQYVHNDIWHTLPATITPSSSHIIHNIKMYNETEMFIPNASGVTRVIRSPE